MKKILIINTGGTFTSIDDGKGLKPSKNNLEIENIIRKINLKYSLDFIYPFSIESPNITFDNWIEFATIIRDNHELYDGFVIIHGTDTLSYTAAMLSYLIQNSDKTIVITGAQYSIKEENTDAINNIKESCFFIANNSDPGVYVVFNKDIIYGTRSKKIKTLSYDAFKSINAPIFGSVQGKNFVANANITNTIESGNTKFYTKLESKIYLLKIYPGIKPEDLYFIETKYKGVVIECYGSAGIPDNLIQIIEKWYNLGIKIVVCTQSLYEGTSIAKYSVGNYLIKNNLIIEAHDMTLEACFTKLSYVLGNFSDTEFKSEFLRPINYDLTI